ncbi:MAG TPA: ABC transporter permease, partial [Arthrobacter sp.]|nr:ABC transporter permease [Arthrobacter sp.]
MFLAIRDIRFAKGRFALMGGVVALVTLLLVLLSGLTAGLGDQSTSAIGKLGAGSGSGGTSRPVDRIVFGAPGTSQPTASFTESEVTAAQVDSWGHVAGVARAEALGISQSRLQGGDGGTANVAVFGVADGGQLAPSPVRAGSVVIGETVAADLSLDVGDTATVGGTEVTVTAIVADQWYSHTGVVWTALPTWAELAHLSPATGSGPASAPGNPPVATVVAVTYQDGAVVDEPAANAMARTVSTSRTG